MVPSISFEAPADRAIEDVCALISEARGFDFKRYRHTTLRRRVLRRMELYRFQSIDEYVQFLKDWPAEVEELSQDILISNPRFFRDPEAFAALTAAASPALCRSRAAPIRVWVPCCSTGEEVYSIAISLVE